MKTARLKTFLLLLNIFLIMNSYAQVGIRDSIQVELKKNIIYGTVGIAGFYAVANANYERVISQKKPGFFKYYLVRAGWGVWGSWGGEGSHGVAGISGLTGSKKSHLEIHLGVTAIYDKTGYQSDVSNYYYNGQFYSSEPTRLDNTRFLPAGAVGYRFQKPGGHFVFRVGAGFPESFYLSLGFCF